MELPGMTDGLLEEELHYVPVTNLDVFFSDMYDYFRFRGFNRIVVSQLCNVIMLGFTIVFSVFLVAYVKWEAFVECHDEASCGSIHDYVASSLFSGRSILFSLLMIIYIILLAAYWFFKVIEASTAVTKAYEMANFYKNNLQIKPHELDSMKWDQITERLIALHEQNIYRVAIKDSLTVHDIVLRIMRKENYMIALINKQLLDIKVPWWAAPFISEGLFLTKSLEFALSFSILNYLFDEQFTISLDFLKNVKKLERRFYYVGLLYLSFTPFMLIFMIVNFFLENSQQFHSNKAYLGPRQWSPLALWKFREFNELPHVFEERILKSYRPANNYINQFHNQYSVVIAQCISYIAGSFVAVLLLISFLSEGAMLYVQISYHNLLWYLGVFSAVYAAARSVIPDESVRVHTETPEELMEKVSAHNHHFPNEWIGRCHTDDVKDEFSELFPYKAKLFLMEICSVILAPLVLCFSLPNSAVSVIEFVRQHSKYVDGVGSVCDYSLFEFNKYGNENYGATVHGSVQDIQKPEGGKLERSYLNFKQAFPNWRGDREGENMISKLQSFRSDREHDREHLLNNILQQSFIQTPLTMQNPTNNSNSNTNLLGASSQQQQNVHVNHNSSNLSHINNQSNAVNVNDNNGVLKNEEDNVTNNNISNIPDMNYNSNSNGNNGGNDTTSDGWNANHLPNGNAINNGKLNQRSNDVSASPFGLSGLWGSGGFQPAARQVAAPHRSAGTNGVRNNLTSQQPLYQPPNPTIPANAYISTIPENTSLFGGDAHNQDSRAAPTKQTNAVEMVNKSSNNNSNNSNNNQMIFTSNPLYRGSPEKSVGGPGGDMSASNYYRASGLQRVGIGASPGYANNGSSSSNFNARRGNTSYEMNASMTDSNMNSVSQLFNSSSGIQNRGDLPMLGSLSFSTNSISQSGIGSPRDVSDVLKSVLKRENIDYENDFFWFNKLHREQRLNQRAQYEEYSTTFVNSGIISSPIRSNNRNQGQNSFSYYNKAFKGFSPSKQAHNSQTNRDNQNRNQDNSNIERGNITRNNSDEIDTIDDSEAAFLLGDQVISPENSPNNKQFDNSASF